MKNKLKNFKNIIIPSNKLNIFILGLIVIGITCGAIYYNLITKNDLELVKTSITSFFNSIKVNNVNSVQALINSLINENFIIIIIYLLGFSIIGIPLIIILIFGKGFVLGFTLSGLIDIYAYKGSLYSFIYLFPTKIISIFTVVLISYYSIKFSLLLIRLIFNKKIINIKKEIKQYTFILILSLILTIISSLYESYLFPILIKMLI